MQRKYPDLRTVYLDQDGVLADFEAAARLAGLKPVEAKMTPGFYLDLPLLPGARAAVQELLSLEHVQLFVATKIPDRNPLAATEKIQWLHKHLPELEERIIITPNKACIGNAGDFLVDDRPHKADAWCFRGTLVQFGGIDFPDWAVTLPWLKSRLAVRQALPVDTD